MYDTEVTPDAAAIKYVVDLAHSLQEAQPHIPLRRGHLTQAMHLAQESGHVPTGRVNMAKHFHVPGHFPRKS